MNNRCAIILITTLLIGLYHGEAKADIYQYVDENGVVHFTNVKVGKNYKKVKAEPRRSSAPVQNDADIRGAALRFKNVPAMLHDAIQSACSKYGVDPSLVYAVIKVESDFNPYAISRKGAMGLMQLMPHTAMELNVKNSFNPVENIEGGVKYLRYLLDRYEGNLSLALAAYNAGETAVKRWGTIPPFRETQDYVKKILKLYKGDGRTFTTQYTIYISYAEDGSLILTDNPSNYKDRSFRRKTRQSL